METQRSLQSALLKISIFGSFVFYSGCIPFYNREEKKEPAVEVVNKVEQAQEQQEIKVVPQEVIEITSVDQFNTTVLKSDKLAVATFGAPWCGACKKLDPILKQFAQAHGSEYTIAHVDTDNLSDLAKQYKVKGIPTTIFFKNGQRVDDIVGATTLEKLTEMAEKYK